MENAKNAQKTLILMKMDKLAFKNVMQIMKSLSKMGIVKYARSTLFLILTIMKEVANNYLHVILWEMSINS